MGRLEGKVAIITGAAQGQGEAEAKLFSHEGANVVVADILDKEGNTVVSEINSSGGQALFTHLDVSRTEDWEKAVAATLSKFGQLDILVNNAAIWLGEGKAGEMSEEEWDKMFSINAKGPFLGTKAALPAMLERGSGSIINIASVSGLHGSKGGATAYGAAKAALTNFTRSTAGQYADKGIRANVIHPGPVTTEMLRGGVEEDRRTAIGENLPLGRLGLPIDIAYGVLYLASEESSWVTGSELRIDGGLYI